MTNINQDLATVLSGHHYILATSGTCRRNPGPGGWGAVLFNLDGECLYDEEELTGGSRQTTNHEMELTAAAAGLALLKGSQSNIVVTSHSQYMIKGMNGWARQWKANGWRRADGKPVAHADLWQTLLASVGDSPVHWRWLPEQEGRSENERAALLARLELNRMLT